MADTKTILFLNCTQHKLTEDQIEAVKNLGDVVQIKDLADIDKSFFNRLKNSPDNYNDLVDLAESFVAFFWNIVLNETQLDVAFDHLYVHLPIGSPAFQFIFAQKVNEILPNWVFNYLTFVFSHSERIVKEYRDVDGNSVKKTVFKFKKFIEV